MFETVLVIDDDAETAQDIVRVLESNNYLVFTAPGEDAGIAMAAKVKPQLIFINPLVSGKSGLEICEAIHDMEQFRNVPIIILSAFEGARDPHFASSYGIVDSLQKPFNPEELVSKTVEALSHAVAETPGAPEPLTAREEYPKLTESEEALIQDASVISETASEKAGDAEGEPGDFPKELFAPDKPVSQPDISETGPAVDKKVEEREGQYVPRRSARRRVQKNSLPVPIVVAASVIMICAAGAIFYLTSPPERKSQKSAVEPMRPQQQQPALVSPSQEAQKPGQSQDEPKPLSKPDASASQPSSSAPLSKPETTSAPSKVPEADLKPGSPGTSTSIPKSKTEAKAPVAPSAEVSEAKLPKKVIYSVQIGAFRSNKNARALAKRYEKKGYEAFTYKTLASEKKILYRVLIGKFTSRQEAAKWARKIATDERIKTTVFKK